VYLVRPYAYEFLRAVQPFFEIICYSNLHSKIIQEIVDHLEAVLNKPVKDIAEMRRQPSNSHRMK
jgi:hypothetical protein